MSAATRVIELPPTIQLVRFQIIGLAPRTKKNHQRILHRANGTPFIGQSKQHNEWADGVFLVPRPSTLPNRPWNCCALIYRDANRGDAVGYYQAIADLLEKWGVVSNDKWIVSWDGTRLRKDKKNPRVEVTLTPQDDT